MSSSVRRVAGTPLTDQERSELRQLAAMPDDQIDFTDIPERVYDDDEQLTSPAALPLEDHTVTLRVDAEVAAWLETSAQSNPHQMNLLLRRAAQHTKRLDWSLNKAS